MLMSVPNLGARSVAYLREMLGLPSYDGVRNISGLTRNIDHFTRSPQNELVYGGL
jgi:hypothetical protein